MILEDLVIFLLIPESMLRLLKTEISVYANKIEDSVWFEDKWKTTTLLTKDWKICALLRFEFGSFQSTDIDLTPPLLISTFNLT